MSDVSGQQQASPDRYLSFKDIDCDGNASRVMDCIVRNVTMPDRNTAFWDYFMKKRAGTSGPRQDDLFLIHAHINQVRELFETWQDEGAMQLLGQLEEDCC
jgi:hypothetical protein